MDFDCRGITGIYRYNYLAALQLEKVEKPESLCQIGGVRCRALGEPPHSRRGLAIYLDRYESEILSRLAPHFRELMNEEAFRNT
jgi:hypothetical protein